MGRRAAPLDWRGTAQLADELAVTLVVAGEKRSEHREFACRRPPGRARQELSDTPQQSHQEPTYRLLFEPANAVAPPISVPARNQLGDLYRGYAPLVSDETPGADLIRHRLLVIPWIRPLAQRFILPDWLAITIGRLIISWRPLDAVELAHELTHVRQWQRHGFLFIARYLAASRKAAKAGLDRYRENEFEIEARAAEEAVRSGLTPV